MGRVRAITAFVLAAVVLTSGGGCMFTESKKPLVKKPDVTQPGVLPRPQDILKGISAPSAVIPASATQPNGLPVSTPPASATTSSALSLSKLTSRFEKKVPVTEMAVAWKNQIAYLPDPTRNGAMGAGVVGQLFLFGPRLDFAEADGTLTVDLIDETPRPAGQLAATPERWQFNKEMLRNLRATDETFGKSYILFLPWPAHKSDITRVRISARYDPDNGHPLYAKPNTLTFDNTPRGPVFESVKSNLITPDMSGRYMVQPQGEMTPSGMTSGGMAPNSPQPSAMLPGSSGAIPIGGASLAPPMSNVMTIGSSQPMNTPLPAPSMTPVPSYTPPPYVPPSMSSTPTYTPPAVPTYTPPPSSSMPTYAPPAMPSVPAYTPPPSAPYVPPPPPSGASGALPLGPIAPVP